MARGIRLFLTAAFGRPPAGDLEETPERVARAWREDLLSGYGEDVDGILEPLTAQRSRDLVALREIEFVSTCAHHLLPFHGRIHMAYLPEGRITGISRLGRLVRCLSRRLQIQEDLTRQIVDALDRRLAPRGAACVVEATHLCMTARGGRASSGVVVTTAFSGIYEKDVRARREVLSILRAGDRAARPAVRARRR
jgi:GTP cyclohydrolase I